MREYLIRIHRRTYIYIYIDAWSRRYSFFFHRYVKEKQVQHFSHIFFQLTSSVIETEGIEKKKRKIHIQYQ